MYELGGNGNWRNVPYVDAVPFVRLVSPKGIFLMKSGLLGSLVVLKRICSLFADLFPIWNCM